MSNILTVEGISKAFPGVKALDSVNFELKKGEVHALVGENGAGKSTLMQILAGIYEKDEGTILKEGHQINIRSKLEAEQFGISIVYQESSLLQNLSVYENLFSGEPPSGRTGIINWKLLRKNGDELLKKLNLEVNPFAQVGTLSAAAQKMIEITRALSKNFQILILDEPTASITVEETDELFAMIKKLKNEGKSIIYISHRLKELQEIADRVTILKDGKHVGTFNIQDITEADICEKMVGRKLSKISYKSQKQKNTVFEIINLSGQGFSDINFQLKEGEFLTITGLTGAGRTELALTLFGILQKEKGEILIDGNKCKIGSPREAMRYGLAYVTEDRNKLGLFTEMSIVENMTSNNIDTYIERPFFRKNEFELLTFNNVREFKIRCSDIDQKVKTLSGGNRQKVCLSRWISFQPKILIVDEPTLGVDVGSKEEIYMMLNNLTEAGMTIIMISSDMIETLSMGDRIMVMHGGRIMGVLEGNDKKEENVVALASGIEINEVQQ